MRPQGEGERTCSWHDYDCNAQGREEAEGGEVGLRMLGLEGLHNGYLSTAARRQQQGLSRRMDIQC